MGSCRERPQCASTSFFHRSPCVLVRARRTLSCRALPFLSMVGGGPSCGTVTSLLRRAREGEVAARDELFARVNGELRRQAQALLARQGLHRGMIQGTDLVNIACANLIARDAIDAEDRAHFFFVLGRKMADVLADLAREAYAAKRGGDVKHVPLFELPDDAGSRTVDPMDLHQCLAALRQADPTAAQVVELHVMAGRTLAQTSELMGLTLHQVRREVAYGMAFLRERLDDGRAHGTP